jgi:glycyl-tRNA synthetase beta chain
VWAIELYGERKWKFQPDEKVEKLCEFFSSRVKNLFLGQGADTLLVEAITAVDALDVWAAARRLDAFTQMSRTPDFEKAVQTFKRVANIVRKQDAVLTGAWAEALFQEQAEKDLGHAVSDFTRRFAELEHAHDYAALFGLLAGLRPAVDAFFETVMVMAEEPDLRNNRLNVLAALLQPLSRLAEFAALQR